ncbi:MAG TPA: hypothetical protein DFR83_18215, partial [Deltaproteobacteria bacterium]|nr:hypothetical protein [Deltaproteobacteria bacterium]
ALETAPTAIILDDAHRADPLTMHVLHGLATMNAPLLLCITSRPPPDAPAETWRSLEALAPASVLHPLNRRETRLLLCARLGVAGIPPHIVELVYARSGGNPMFIDHLADHLQSTGAVRVTDHHLVVHAERIEHWRAELPVALQSLLLSRVDRLGTDAQFSLKVATTFDARFDLEGLRAIHPFGRRREQLRTDLEELEQEGIVERIPGTSAWRFRHALVRDALRAILSERQRRDLKRKAERHRLARSSTPGGLPATSRSQRSA